MNWKRVISGVLAAAMLSALPVQLLASAEGAEAAAEVNTWEDLTSVESLEDSNTFYYNKNGYTFETLAHPETDGKTADGGVDYLGEGAVDVVTDPEAEGYNAGDRGQLRMCCCGLRRLDLCGHLLRSHRQHPLSDEEQPGGRVR